MFRIEIWVDPTFLTSDQFNIVGQRANGELVMLYASARQRITTPEQMLDKALEWVADNIGVQQRLFTEDNAS